MGNRFLELSEKFPGVFYGVTGIAAAAIIVSVNMSRGSNLNAIPTVGSSGGWLASCWAGFFRFNITDVIQEGYEKHKSAPFKIAERYRWTVIVSSREHVEELRKAPDDVFSFEEGTNELLNSNYTVEKYINETPIHVAAIRSQFNRNLGPLFPAMRDEVCTAFDDVLDLEHNEWKSVLAMDAVRQVICRTSYRFFVGLPLCRNQDWIDVNVQYAVDIIKTGILIGLLPVVVRPLAGYLLAGPILRDRKRALKHAGPIIEERLKCFKEHGNDWEGKPNDLISWMIEEAKVPQLTAKSLTSYMLVANFAALTTPPGGFTNALFYLAANPQYIQPLRDEVEAIVEKRGWTKESLDEMHKVDSFLRECLRFEGTSALSLTRKALKDFTFLDGTFIPKGTLIAAAARSLHNDDKFYPNANVFKPFRFADIREEGEEHTKCQLVSTGTEYLPFGHGRRACPGRFFAATVMKSMLAHLVVTYDVKLEDDTTRPSSVRYGSVIAANPHARVLFRKRVM